MVGTGEIKYLRRMKTSPAVLQVRVGSLKAKRRQSEYKLPDPPGWWFGIRLTTSS